MNKAKLKAYAPQARRDFIQMIRQRADLLGLTKSEIAPPNTSGEVAVIEGRPYPKRYAELHKRLAEKIKTEGLESLIGRIAYSWFNRFAALRFMEVNGFLSHGFRILSNREADKNEPEILTHAAEIDLPGLDKAKVIELKLAGNKDAELYRLLLIAQCNELNRAMPFLFERINDETEILLPDNLLATDSVIRKMVAAIDEADWAEVEIIGWLYQFYISEKKDEVIGKTVKSEDIPAATQLFTPNWIVKYMTQNSLGRLWLEANPHSQLAQNMEFYIKPAEENLVQNLNSTLNPEEIKVLDPACGSGHILVEAYELLKLIYTERGYSSRDIPLLILEKNLFGLDIDERAAQMASFALLMKARRDDRRIFERLAAAQIENPQAKIPNVIAVPDSSQIEHAPQAIAEMFISEQANPGAVSIRDDNFLFGEMENQPSLMLAGNSEQSAIQNLKSEISEVSEQNVIDLLELFAAGKTLGSLVRVPHGFAAVVDKLERATWAKRAGGNFYEQVAASQLEPFVRAAQMLAQQYDCVIANPPYMDSKIFNVDMKAFANRQFPDSKKNLFAMFIERNIELTKRDGFLGFMTPYVWMFISSYEKLREIISEKAPIASLVKPSYTAFFESAIVAIVTFVLRKDALNFGGDYFDLGYLGSAESQPIKFKEALNNSESEMWFHASSNDFKKIPGTPIAYWVSNRIRENFEKGTPLNEIAAPKIGMRTGDNERFLRRWFEVAQEKVGFRVESAKEAQLLRKKWFPYNKGGDFRKWYGNNEYFVNWENDGNEIKELVRLNYPQLGDNLGWKISNESYYFRPSVSWSFISSSSFGVRRSGKGFIFDVGGSSVFPDDRLIDILTGFLCSKLAFEFMRILNPTPNMQVGDVASLPILEKEFEQIKPQADEIVEEAVAIARADWDSFETSWDFARLPMIAMMNGEHAAANTPEASENTLPPVANTLSPAPLTLPPAPFTQAPAEFTTPPAELTMLPAPFTMPPAELTMSPAEFTQPTAANNSVEAAWNRWKSLCDWRIARMQELETENNRLFINAYGLADELSPEVPLSQITLARADAEKDTRRLLSYFVACLMGRYSLDESGLIYADAGGKDFDPTRYQTFPADDDGIVPVTDLEWFPQEAARQFEKFIKVVWSEANLQSNLRWIAEQLGGKASEMPIETVRRYFSNSFFKDHLQTYKKRPIYWLFSSGKQKAFEALVYLHRYNEATLPRMRHEYVLPLMSKLTAQIETLDGLKDSAATTSERTKLEKQIETFRKKQTELAAFDEKLRHYSDLRISLDLDDGVKVNYGKFGDLLAEVKQVAAMKE